MKKQLSKQSINSPFCGFRGLLALLFFPLLGLGGWSVASAQSVTITPIGANYSNKTVTFRVSWSGSFAPDNRVWVWIDFCPITGVTPDSFGTATISAVTPATATAASSMRGFFVTANPATVTATLNTTQTKFNWCVYGSGAPPRAELQPDGSYLLKGTPPFKVNGDWKDESMTSYDAGCIESFTDFTENPAGSVTAKPSVASVSSPAICNNTTANLTATVSGGTTTAMTYTWNIGGTSTTTTGATRDTSALTATTTYTVQARNAAGCTSTVSNTGTITVRPNFTAGSITTASGTTTEGTNPNITIASSTDAYGGDGSITYQWRRSGDSNATYDYNAQTYPISNNSDNYSAAGTYKINRYARDGTCNTGWEPSTGTYTLTVTSGFPPGAGTKTWTCGAQTWSDAVRATASACMLVDVLSDDLPALAQYRIVANLIDVGYYYNWTCAANSQATLCPHPWHLPSHAELETLVTCLLNSDDYFTLPKAGHAKRSSIYDVNQCVGMQSNKLVFEAMGYSVWLEACKTRSGWAGGETGAMHFGLNVHCVR